MNDALIGTAILGFREKSPFIKNLISLYDTAVWLNGTNNKFAIKLPSGKEEICGCNNDLFTYYILDVYDDFRLNGEYCETDDFCLYPKKIFEIGSVLGRTYCVHRCEATWKNKDKKRTLFKIIKNVAKNIPFIHFDAVIRNITYKKHAKNSLFYERYLNDSKRG